VTRQEEKLPLITRPKLAERWDVCDRTVDRRQKNDPHMPASRIINGYHYFELDEIAAYERALAGAPRIAKAPPIARPKPLPKPPLQADAPPRTTPTPPNAGRALGTGAA
jgi:hypothetical protein